MNFSYTAKNAKGELVEGDVEAPNQDQAISVLHRRSLIVLSLQSKEGGPVLSKDIGSIFSRPSRKDIIIFTRQLATLIDAEIPLLEALRTLSNQTDKDSFKKIIDNVAVSVEGGSSLSLALSQHDDVFDSFYINLVKVGEVSGKMQDTLLYLADYLERTAAIISKIRGALFYPLFVLGALVLVGVIMMTSVIPQLLQIVTDSGIDELPLTTRMLIWITDIVNNYLFLWMFILIIIVVALAHYFRTENGHMKWDRFKITMPQFGTITRKLYIARISETLATLIKSGVPILESLHITGNVVGNRVYQNILLEAEENVRAGGTISDTLAQHEEFPRLVGAMLATGERSGRVEYMLENILKFYDTEAQESIKNISQLIEPILILLLGLGVGGLVSAVLLPIYSIVNAT